MPYIVTPLSFVEHLWKTQYIAGPELTLLELTEGGNCIYLITLDN